MTKPIIFLLLLVGGALAAGAGVVTYSEWQEARRSSAPSAPPGSAGTEVAASEEPAAKKGPPVAAEDSLATPQPTPSAPSGPAPAQRLAREQKSEALPPAATGADTERQQPPAGPAQPESTAEPGESAAPEARQHAAQPSEPATADETAQPAPVEAPAATEPLPRLPQPSDSAARQPDETQAAPPARVEPPEDAPTLPSFDIVRVEPTGEAVIAGNAPSGAKVEVLSNGEVVAETSADRSGNWVALPERPLRPGSHDLSIRTVGPDGEETQSEQHVAVAVPEEPGEEVVAVLDRPGQPSAILAAPDGESSRDAAEAPRAAAEPPQKLEPMATANDVSGGRPPILSVDAVEAEGRTMYVAGAGDPGALVRVYVDGELVGEAQAGAGGRWLVEANRALEEGEVTVRADQLKAGTAQVEARAEVPFIRRLDMESLLPATEAGVGAGDSAAGEALPEPEAVIIRRGDNLWTISRRTYGRGIRYTTIYKANEDQIRDPHWIYPGQVFMLPTRDRAWTEE